jgi:hypothetical protein
MVKCNGRLLEEAIFYDLVLKLDIQGFTEIAIVGNDPKPFIEF